MYRIALVNKFKGGNGLGLSIAQKIVLLHHGWISIEVNLEKVRHSMFIFQRPLRL
ncbi:ATP-binding protein [Pontibacillus yanchengensis]|uniref:ATP-binding protein n=1 Tax=Pontibacillus yanchengensis TaxID=462910 RepID=UPI001F433DEE|nr:ATP-binding protein [Pontibacillus yanchengensis]